MKVRQLHSWDLSPSDAVSLQRKLTVSVEEAPFDLGTATLIAGVDVSSSKFDPLLTAGVVVWNRVTGEVAEAVWAQQKQSFPYIPGLLSFREIPVLAEALKQLTTQPDAILVDGQGKAHPRHLGIASHLGLLLDVPTVGVAKSILVGVGVDPDVQAGSHAPLVDKDEWIGEIVRTKDNVKPVYVSVGNRITLDAAIELVLECTRGYRLPEPTRLAHLHVNLARTTGHGLPIGHVQQVLL